MSESDRAYARYVQINLPHSRTVIRRIGGALEARGVLEKTETAARRSCRRRTGRSKRSPDPTTEDPAFEAAVRAADAVAEQARVLVSAILASSARSDRLGQHVRNLFECLGLPEEGARLSLECGERPDSLLR